MSILKSVQKEIEKGQYKNKFYKTSTV